MVKNNNHAKSSHPLHPDTPADVPNFNEKASGISPLYIERAL